MIWGGPGSGTCLSCDLSDLPAGTQAAWRKQLTDSNVDKGVDSSDCLSQSRTGGMCDVLKKIIKITSYHLKFMRVFWFCWQAKGWEAGEHEACDLDLV